MEEYKEEHLHLGFTFNTRSKESYGISGKLLFEYQDLFLPDSYTLYITSEPRNQSPLEFKLAFNGEHTRTKKEVTVYDWLKVQQRLEPFYSSSVFRQPDRPVGSAKCNESLPKTFASPNTIKRFPSGLNLRTC